MDCKLQVFKCDPADGSLAKTYRFAVVDLSRSSSYPANFVCLLPAKVDHQGKGKVANVFGTLFGDKSVDFAIDLLNEALRSERDLEVKTEIERRLKLLDPQQVNVVKCSGCNKTFQPRKIRKYKQNLCPECLKKRFAVRQ
jgi:DNA-directed RNA polymerase subunit RPC12/RpoP